MLLKLKLNYFIIALLLLIMNQTANAQFYPNTYRGESDWQVNIGVSALGTPFYPRKPGVGASIGLKYLIEPTISARATVGYNIVQDQNKSRDFKYIPVQVGVQGYLTPDFYVSGDAGFASSNKIFANKIGLWLLISPGIGYSFRNNGLDVGLNYDLLHRSNDYVGVIGLKLSYSFNLKSY